MAFIRSRWFWNMVLVLTVVVCLAVLTLHYKNWLTNDNEHLEIRSGFYHVDISYTELDSVYFVEKIPMMERLNGFSALEQEKGIFREFKDSLTDKKVRVLVDNINQQKIKLVYKDSLNLYLNLKDSLASTQLLADLKIKMESNQVKD